MWNWLGKLLGSKKPAGTAAKSPGSQRDDSDEYHALEISKLYVKPDADEDFDPECCRKLLSKITSLGATHVDELNNIVVTLEDFFEGNRTKHSIAANVTPDPPYDTASAWYERLKSIRATHGVKDVLVAIYMIEPDEDGCVRSWPYADTIWIYSSLDQDEIEELLAPLEPDEIREGSPEDSEYPVSPPRPPSPGVKAYWVWWD